MRHKVPAQQANADRQASTGGEVRLLGPVRLVGPGGPVALPDDAGLLLGLLALRAGKPVPDEELRAAMGIPAEPHSVEPRSAVPGALAGAAGRLAAALAESGSPDALAVRPDGYLLRMPGSQIDAHRFSQLVARARRRMAAGELAAASRLYEAALTVWPAPSTADGVPSAVDSPGTAPAGGAQFAAGSPRSADDAASAAASGAQVAAPSAGNAVAAPGGGAGVAAAVGPDRMAGGVEPLCGHRLGPTGWAAIVVARLRQARIDAFEDRWECLLRLAVAAHAAAGGPVADRAVVAAGAASVQLARTAAAELTAALSGHPLRARLWELRLVAAFLADGRRAAAEVRRHAREVFLEQLGVEPAGRVCELAEAVRRGELPTDWATGQRSEPVPDIVAVGRPASRPRPGARLPVPLTALLGRDELLDVVDRRLAGHRLVTLTGTGGAGKTRLAVAAAARITGRPVWFVDLTAVESPVRVPRAVAAALGVPDVGRDVVETLVADVGAVPAVLVLDNCEHLVTGAAELVDRLLARCAGLRVLATSRVALRLPGESRIRVPALAGPAVGTGHSITALTAHPATRLFLERAREFSGRPVPEASADEVVRLCAELDGLPLAIELAAARTPLLSVNEIVTRLRAGVRLLRSPDPTVAHRHRSVAAAVESSLAQLDADACRLFDRLSICAGGFDVEVARAIGGPSAPAALAVLVEASLAEPVPASSPPPSVAHPFDGQDDPSTRSPDSGTAPRCTTTGTAPTVEAATAHAVAAGAVHTVEAEAGWVAGSGRVRYRMLEPIRRHALARLVASGAEVAARRALATYCLGLAQRADARLRGTAQGRWLARLRTEEANLRSAMTWLTEAGAGGPAHGDLRLAVALSMYCRLEGHYREGYAWLAAALARHPAAPPRLRARAGTGAAMLAMLRCDYPAAIGHAELARSACQRSGDRRAEARVAQILGSVAREQARYAESACHLAGAGAIFAECGDEWGEAQTTELRGFTAWLAGDLDRADSRLRASLRRYEQLGDALAAASAVMNLGAVALYRNDLDRASSLLDVALQRYSTVGFPEGVGWAHNLRGLVELRGGRFRRAAGHLRTSLAAHRQVGDRWRTASVLEALAEVARLDGVPGGAARLLGAAARIRDEIGAPVPHCERPDVEATRSALRAELGDRFAEACRWGREAGVEGLLAAGWVSRADHAVG